MTEIEFCLQKTRNNIASGTSGFSGAFYKAFWPELKHTVHLAINSIYYDNELPESLSTSKTMAFSTSGRAAALLGPLQLGNGMRGGCEALVHSLRAILEDQDIAPIQKWLLQVDLENAFNQVDRTRAYQEIRQHFPDISPWVESAYGCQAELLYGDQVILSCLGWHQGDPLASLLFAVAFHPIVIRIKEEVPNLKANIWFLYDGNLMGSREDLIKAWDIFSEDGPSRGLHLSAGVDGKSTIWCPNQDPQNRDPLGRGVPIVEDEGVKLLGAPLGSLAFEGRLLNKRVDKIERVVSRLSHLQDPHLEYALLRSCFSIPKLSYSLRTTDTTPHQTTLIRFDNLMRGTFEDIVGAPLTDPQWIQATLPVSMGGLGFRSAAVHAPIAYLASVSSSSAIIEEITEKEEGTNKEPALALLNTRIDDPITVEDLLGTTQKVISHQADLHTQQQLVTSLQEVHDRARLKSLELLRAGDWLNAIPSRALGLHLRPRKFSVAVQYRLGMNVFAESGPCTACQSFSDQKGHHAIACAYDGERIARHNQLRDALYQTAAQAALGPTKEERALIPGRNARPADVYIPNWVGGRDTALDVTVVSPLQQALVDRAADEPGFALTHAYQRKMRQSHEDCNSEGISFIPLPVETLGSWHIQAVGNITRLARKLARHTGREDEEVVRHLFQRLGILLMKGNAALMLSRSPDFAQQQVDGDQETS